MTKPASTHTHTKSKKQPMTEIAVATIGTPKGVKEEEIHTITDTSVSIKLLPFCRRVGKRETSNTCSHTSTNLLQRGNFVHPIQPESTGVKTKNKRTSIHTVGAKEIKIKAQNYANLCIKYSYSK